LRGTRVLGVWIIVAVACVVIFVAWAFLGYSDSLRTLPAEMTISDLPVGGRTREEALNAVEVALATPLELLYQDDVILLPRDTVGFRYDVERSTVGIDAAVEYRRGLDGFVAYVLRSEAEPIDVPVMVSFSRERLEGFLARIADEHDRPPDQAGVVAGENTFRAGEPGYELDVQASLDKVAAALASASAGQTELVLRYQPAAPTSLRSLGGLIRTLLDGHGAIVPGVFVKDLRTGHELSINGEVAFSAPGVIHVAVAEEAYRALEQSPDTQTSALLSSTVSADGAEAANELVRDVIGSGDFGIGAETLSWSMQYLGLANTFMTAPYGAQGQAASVVTPANSRTDITTNPDRAVQTTPQDIGLFLEMLYQCGEGGGALLAAYRGQLTPEACEEIISWMTANQTDSLIGAGVPEGTRVARKSGWTGDTHADAAIVFSQGADFVLTIFLHHPDYLDWEQSAPLFADIAAATHSFFSPTSP
jgi:hypothetical protein